MTAIINGIQYIGGQTSPNENAVLAGPVTFPGTVTVTGVLVIV
jgi:hypothetical protein